MAPTRVTDPPTLRSKVSLKKRFFYASKLASLEEKMELFPPAMPSATQTNFENVKYKSDISRQTHMYLIMSYYVDIFSAPK